MTAQLAGFVALAQQPGANRRALCRAFGIAPMTGYKWLQRYSAAGAAGLQDRSRRAHRSPAQTAPAIERAVLALRAQHPAWGGRKLRVLLALRLRALPPPDHPRRPLALRPRPGRLSQSAHRHRAGPPGHSLPAFPARRWRGGSRRTR